jgi:hypothetical protein
MKSIKNLVSTAALITALITLSFASVYTAAQDQGVPTKKEFKTLLKTAKEPPEHLKIAEYYRHQAAKLRADAKEHAELAQTYAKTVPNPMEAKHGDTFGAGASHCKKWAELQAEEAREAEALATLHEDMAKAAEHKQP